MPIHIGNVESTDNRNRMVLERFETQMSVEVEELGENDHRRGDSIRRHQNSETSRKGETKRHFIVSTLELQIDFQIFQNIKKR